MKLHRFLPLAVISACLLSLPLAALALDPEKELLADFPPESIDSVDRADEAIRRLPAAREHLNHRFSAEKADCLKRFFVASCLSDLRGRERSAARAVNRVEVEAKALLRKERAAERDRAVEERERRAAEAGGRAIPISGAARHRDGDAAAEPRAPRERSTQIRVERVPEPAQGDAVEPQVPGNPPTPAAAVPAVPQEPVPLQEPAPSQEPVPSQEPARSHEPAVPQEPAPSQVPAPSQAPASPQASPASPADSEPAMPANAAADRSPATSLAPEDWSVDTRAAPAPAVDPYGFSEPTPSAGAGRAAPPAAVNAPATSVDGAEPAAAGADTSR